MGSLLPRFETTPPAAVLRLESNPPGAEAVTSTQQSCKTPCSLTVASDKNFRVAFSLEGYKPTDVEIVAIPPIDPRSDAAVHFSPNPVLVTLEKAAPEPRKKRPVRRRAAPKPAAAKPAAARPAAAKPVVRRPAPAPAALPPAAAAPPPAAAAPPPPAASPWPPAPGQPR